MFSYRICWHVYNGVNTHTHILGPGTLHRNGTLPFNHYFFILKGGKFRLITHRHHYTHWCFLWCHALTAVQIVICCHLYTIYKPTYFTLTLSNDCTWPTMSILLAFYQTLDMLQLSIIQSFTTFNTFKIHCIFKYLILNFLLSFSLIFKFFILLSNTLPP